jgi:2Fe-2S ferredoxin
MKVKFLPSGEEHEIEFNETVLHLAQRVGIHIQSVCKGIPSCAECRIQIKEGSTMFSPPIKKKSP